MTCGHVFCLSKWKKLTEFLDQIFCPSLNLFWAHPFRKLRRVLEEGYQPYIFFGGQPSLGRFKGRAKGEPQLVGAPIMGDRSVVLRFENQRTTAWCCGSLLDMHLFQVTLIGLDWWFGDLNRFC